MQDKNFAKQQNILQNLADSSRDTASILSALKSTTETMNQNIVTLQGPVERNAKAAEATSSTASKSLDISTRAYLSTAVVMEGAPTVGQKWRFSVSTTNTGKTAAVEVVSAVFQALAPPDISLATLHSKAVLIPPQGSPSKSVIAMNQQLAQPTEFDHPLTEDEVTRILDGRLRAYVFSDISYEDIFAHRHHTQVCVVYESSLKQIRNCSGLNKSD
jgi:hypothetical protein